MLPFLAPKKSASIVVIKHHSDGKQEPMREEGEHAPELLDFMKELIDAVHAKDAHAAADAFMAAAQFVDELPHEEGPHVEEE